jgi:hypothetical protein
MVNVFVIQTHILFKDLPNPNKHLPTVPRRPKSKSTSMLLNNFANDAAIPIPVLEEVKSLSNRRLRAFASQIAELKGMHPRFTCHIPPELRAWLQIFKVDKSYPLILTALIFSQAEQQSRSSVIISKGDEQH